MNYSRAILGDNQFLGVNHANQAKAAQLFKRFKQPDAILDIISAAYGAGVRDFMFTTHDRYELVFDEIRRSNLFPGMYYTPCIPYAHKYWSKLSNQNIVQMFTSTALQINPIRAVSSGIAMMMGKPTGLVRLFVEIEALMCKGLPVRGVFLQNAAFDMLMAIEAHKELAAFAEVVTQRLGALPGFITMNHPKAVDTLCNEVGLDQPWICANYNLGGFRTNPSKPAVESSFASSRTKNIAMSVFASGNAGGQSSLDYVISKMNGDEGVDAILFGSSNANNIRHNTKTILAAK